MNLLKNSVRVYANHNPQARQFANSVICKIYVALWLSKTRLKYSITLSLTAPGPPGIYASSNLNMDWQLEGFFLRSF